MSKIKMMGYCQNEIEGNEACDSQCGHCFEYYKTTEIDKVAKILESHNKWRRSDEFIKEAVMENPFIIGYAIDYAIKILKELKK